MKCIILAAGEGIRMRPLTVDTPKPMLLLRGKPLLEHIIETLPKEVDELILVVGYLSHQIEDYFGSEFGRLRIYYAVQKEKTGTYDALELCSHLLEDNERFLLLYADDLHGKDGLKKCAESKDLCLIVSEVSNPKKFGVVELDKNDLIKNIEEKPENPKSNLVSTGVLMLDKNIFKYPARMHFNGERYLTDSIEQMIEAGHKFVAVRSEFWLPMGYPQDLEEAEKNYENYSNRLK
jgi:NDP-sugar pyrophosphorylase family protein